MQSCANSRQPIGNKKMNTFLKILRRKIKTHNKDIKTLINHTEDFLNLCNYPYDEEKPALRLSKKEEAKLKKIVEKIKDIKYTLEKTQTKKFNQNLEDF